MEMLPVKGQSRDMIVNRIREIIMAISAD